MCEFCPASGTGTCAICGHKRVAIDRVYHQAGRVVVVLYGRNRETIHQQCGGGRRVIRKKVGHS